MTFKEWIMSFKEDNSPIGDVAREISLDPDFPKSNDYKTVFEYLNRHMPDDGIDAFRKAWSLYFSSK